jgi:phage gpG-like protein
MYKSYKKEVLASLKKARTASLDAVGLVVQSESVKKMTQNGAYAGYSGDMVDTGRLRASIKHDIASENSVQIGTNVEYADYVFLGTYKMVGRNAILDSVIENRKKIRDVVADVYKRMVR